MTDIDLTAATKAALIAMPNVRASIADYEGIIRAALPTIREQLSQQLREDYPSDAKWQASKDAYAATGYEDIPDEHEEMFWDAGYRQARDIAVQITRGTSS